MGQNNFSLLGMLKPLPDAEPRLISLNGYDIHYVEAVLESGPAYAGERHPVYLTGKAAEIAYQWFQKHPNGFNALAQGTLKTFDEKTRPVVFYLNVYEISSSDGAEKNKR
jgi:hypothetical protein